MVTFIIDALDECHENISIRQFIEWLVETTQEIPISPIMKRPLLLKVLIINRSTIFLQRAFCKLNNLKLQMEDHLHDVNADIRTMI